MKNLKKFIALTSTLCALNACGGGSLNDNAGTIKSSPAPSAAPTIPTFTGKRADYMITRTTNGITVQEKSGNVSATDIGNATSVKFSDMTLNLTIGEKAASIATKELNSLIDLYIAFFNRVPDADGLSYWIDQLKSGKTLDQIAQNFYSAALLYSAQTGYDAKMTDADFVRVIYKNVLGRSGANAPPNADVQYWADELKNGRSKGNLISVMLVSARSFANDATWGWVTTLLDNKVAIGTYFAVQQGINYNTPEESISKTIAIVAAITPTTTATAKNLIGVSDAQFNLSVPANPSNATSKLSVAQLQACPNNPNASAYPNFYKCMVGTISGEDTLNKIKCTFTVEDNGTIIFDYGQTRLKATLPYIISTYWKFDQSRASNWSMTLSLIDSSFNNLTIRIDSPEFAAQNSFYYPGLIVITNINSAACYFPF